jgi:hypothetical protein
MSEYLILVACISVNGFDSFACQNVCHVHYRTHFMPFHAFHACEHVKAMPSPMYYLLYCNP